MRLTSVRKKRNFPTGNWRRALIDDVSRDDSIGSPICLSRRVLALKGVQTSCWPGLLGLEPTTEFPLK